jgi:ribose transport system substrate-binding protein
MRDSNRGQGAGCIRQRSRPFNATLAAAKNSGIKVIFTDETTSQPGVAVTSITSDNVLGGQLAGRTLLKLVNGSGQVLVLSGSPGSSSLIDRVEGFHQALAGHSGVSDLGIQYDQQDPTKSEAIVSATLAAHPNLAGVFDTAAASVPGVVNALERAGKIGKVKVVAFDSTPQELQEVKAGQIQAMVGQSPQLMGVDAVKSAFAAFEGKSVPRVQLVQIGLITRANADAPSIEKFLYHTGGCSA